MIRNAIRKRTGGAVLLFRALGLTWEARTSPERFKRLLGALAGLLTARLFGFWGFRLGWLRLLGWLVRGEFKAEVFRQFVGNGKLDVIPTAEPGDRRLRQSQFPRKGIVGQAGFECVSDRLSQSVTDAHRFSPINGPDKLIHDCIDNMQHRTV